MRERNDIAVGLLVAFLLLFPLGYLVHVAPRFPGSLAGGVLGVLAAGFMLLTLPYVVVKHVKAVERWTGRFVSKPTLLALHVYAGVLAPTLGLVHAAHTFASPIGVALTGLVLLTVLSGFVGRYLLAQTARALRGRRSELASLQAAYNHLPPPPAATLSSPAAMSRWKRLFFVPGDPPEPAAPARPEALAAALADTEFAIRAEAATQRLFSLWRRLHIVVGVLVYLVLLLHIGAALYFGLRWL